MHKKSTTEVEKKPTRGRPRKIAGDRQQVPVYVPEAVYFEILDWVNLQKRVDRQYSMNDLFMEALELWLSEKGKPPIQELIKKLEKQRQQDKSHK